MFPLNGLMLQRLREWYPDKPGYRLVYDGSFDGSYFNTGTVYLKVSNFRYEKIEDD